MSDESTFRKGPGSYDWTADAALASGEIRQLPNGLAGIYDGLQAKVSGDKVVMATEGRYDVAKSTSVVVMAGDELWWDNTNSQATYRGGGDFRLGIALEDATAGASEVLVDLNAHGEYHIEQGVTGFDVATTLTAGAPNCVDQFGTAALTLDTTAEAQMASMLSEDSVAVADKFIAEFFVEWVDDGDHAAFDFNVGMANAGHASDADSITESVFVHSDGDTTDILLESDDGTTEVAATDSTVDYTLGTRKFVQMDFRDSSDVQIYIDGVLMLGGTTFDVSAATGPWKALAHLEKSSNDTPGEVRVRGFRVRKLAAA